jgi:hypothetical protein
MYVYTPTMYRHGMCFQVAPTTYYRYVLIVVVAASHNTPRGGRRCEFSVPSLNLLIGGRSQIPISTAAHCAAYLRRGTYGICTHRQRSGRKLTFAQSFEIRIESNAYVVLKSDFKEAGPNCLAFYIHAFYFGSILFFAHP